MSKRNKAFLFLGGLVICLTGIFLFFFRKGNSELFDAIKYNNKKAIKEVINNFGIDVNDQFYEGETP